MKELLDAYVAAYSNYTYTQNPETGIIWVHPKNLDYDEILNEKVVATRSFSQLPAYSVIYNPVENILFPELKARPNPPIGPLQQLGYGVDLQEGVYSVRQVLDACCLANPSIAFMASPFTMGHVACTDVETVHLQYDNPFAPPRALAVEFWNAEIGKSTNGIPSGREVVAAMSDRVFGKRWAARAYLEAAQVNYDQGKLMQKCRTPEEAVWTALGIQAATTRGVWDKGLFYRMGVIAPEFKNQLAHIENPGVALLASLELAKEGTNTAYLDAIVSKHQFSTSEINTLLPEIQRMAFGSQEVMIKLNTMAVEIPDLPTKIPGEMGDSGILTVAGLNK